MIASNSPPWLRTVLFVGVAYVVFGLVFGALAGGAASSQMRTVWRLMAWALSGMVFAAHIAYDHFRLRNAKATAALHAALASAVGAFFLAAAANIHAMQVGSAQKGMLALSLLIWPLMTAIGAFPVAWVFAALLSALRRKA